MFDYTQIVQQRQRQEEIAKDANAVEPEGWTHPVPNIFDKLLAVLKSRQRATKSAERQLAPKSSLSTK